MDGEQHQVVVPVVFGIPLSYGGLLQMPSLADCKPGLPREANRDNIRISAGIGAWSYGNNIKNKEDCPLVKEALNENGNRDNRAVSKSRKGKQEYLISKGQSRTSINRLSSQEGDVARMLENNAIDHAEQVRYNGIRKSRYDSIYNNSWTF
ncbi:hypothetical protein KPH14_009733 [Odynerus spinipes]|uniref:Uncharacterized protein n=1 Tax=Odynerus spinipes TaxID=1348599 RepID=A0AAD9RQN4_9HYME|nr:hypothetical protein KPH14_009733 [Odynerus spinipes]